MFLSNETGLFKIHLTRDTLAFNMVKLLAAINRYPTLCLVLRYCHGTLFSEINFGSIHIRID